MVEQNENVAYEAAKNDVSLENAISDTRAAFDHMVKDPSSEPENIMATEALSDALEASFTDAGVSFETHQHVDGELNMIYNDAFNRTVEELYLDREEAIADNKAFNLVASEAYRGYAMENAPAMRVGLPRGFEQINNRSISEQSAQSLRDSEPHNYSASIQDDYVAVPLSVQDEAKLDMSVDRVMESYNAVINDEVSSDPFLDDVLKEELESATNHYGSDKDAESRVVDAAVAETVSHAYGGQLSESDRERAIKPKLDEFIKDNAEVAVTPRGGGGNPYWESLDRDELMAYDESVEGPEPNDSKDTPTKQSPDTAQKPTMMEQLRAEKAALLAQKAASEHSVDAKPKAEAVSTKPAGPTAQPTMMEQLRAEKAALLAKKAAAKEIDPDSLDNDGPEL